MILASIDVTLLDKARFKEVVRRNGKPAKFCELVFIETPNGAHGDYMIKQSITKEERAAKLEMPILGNGKIVGGGASPTARTQQPANNPASAGGKSDDVPF